MDPQAQFCHNPDCPARGHVGHGNIRIHSRKERRYRCTTCGRTFAATRGTPFYRLKTPPETVTIVLPCSATAARCRPSSPPSASTSAPSPPGRTGPAGTARTSTSIRSCAGRSIWGTSRPTSCTSRRWAGRLWMAMAMAVPSRLWLGGVISPRRDLALITAVVRMVRSCARSLAILVCVDGLASYVTAFVPGLPRPGAHRPAGPAALGGGVRAAARPGDQAPQPAVAWWASPAGWCGGRPRRSRRCCWRPAGKILKDRY